MKPCAKCGRLIEANLATCTQCTALESNVSIGTAHLRSTATVRRVDPFRQEPTVSRLPEWLVELQIRGLAERFHFVEGTEVMLGRGQLTSCSVTYVDLDRYGGRQRGVSRQHAVLRFTHKQLTVTDLSSLNGTLVNLTRLQAHQPYPLHNGDRITLGALSIVIRLKVDTYPQPTEPRGRVVD